MVGLLSQEINPIRHHKVGTSYRISVSLFLNLVVLV